MPAYGNINRISLQEDWSKGRFCPRCGLPQKAIKREDRSPMEQWECPAGHAFPMFGRRDEGEV